MPPPTRFPISFEPAYARLSRALFLSPSDSYVEVAGDVVSVRMAWAFRASFPRARVRAVAPLGKRVRATRGVHGFAGRWLVNGAGDGVLVLTLSPAPRAYVLGFPVKLAELQVSVEDPAGLASALGHAGAGGG